MMSRSFLWIVLLGLVMHYSQGMRLVKRHVEPEKVDAIDVKVEEADNEIKPDDEGEDLKPDDKDEDFQPDDKDEDVQPDDKDGDLQPPPPPPPPYGDEEESGLIAPDEEEEISNDEEVEPEFIPDEDDNSGNADETDGYPFFGGFKFDTPFFDFGQVEDYFKNFERAMEMVFKQTLAQLGGSPDTYENTTEKVVEIDGRKYKVQTTIVRGGDKNNAVSIQAVSTVPADKRKKRSIIGRSE